jgi:aspartate aminotransferase
MLNDGDEVILPAPYWFRISKSWIIWWRSCRSSYICRYWFQNPEQLEAAITPKNKMMWFSSPVIQADLCTTEKN